MLLIYRPNSFTPIGPVNRIRGFTVDVLIARGKSIIELIIRGKGDFNNATVWSPHCDKVALSKKRPARSGKDTQFVEGTRDLR